MSEKQPRCSKCDTTKNLFVWDIPDPYTDYPLCVEIICQNCPEPIDPWKDHKSEYDPDFHDEMFRFKDYSVGLARMYSGPNDVKGLCFECDGDVNMTKGYGSEYVPYKDWISNQQTSVAYCEPCYRIRCKNHVNFEQEAEIEKLTLKLAKYRERTIDGRLREVK